MMRKGHLLFGLCLCSLFLCVFALAEDVFNSEYGIRFGMSIEEVKAIEKEHNHIPFQSDPFLDRDAYILEFIDDIYFGSLKCSSRDYYFSLSDQKLFQCTYSCEGENHEYNYIKNTLVDQYGKPMGNDADSEKEQKWSNTFERLAKYQLKEDTHWLVTYDKYELGVDLWLNDYSKIFIVFYNASDLVSFGDYSSSTGADDLVGYTDNELGIIFKYPKGWVSVADDYRDATFKVELNPTDGSLALLQYNSVDLWGGLSSTQKENLRSTGINSRSDVNMTNLVEDDFLGMFGYSNIIDSYFQTFGENTFYIFETQKEEEYGGNTFQYAITTAITINNGYIYAFRLTIMGLNQKDHIGEFEEVLKSVTLVSNGQAKQSATNAKKSSTVITLTPDNIDSYFYVSLECKDFYGDLVTMHYEIVPNSQSYSDHDESSTDVIVSLLINIYNNKFSSNPITEKSYTVILKRDENYERSGDIKIKLPIQDLETVYWDYSITKASGRIVAE